MLQFLQDSRDNIAKLFSFLNQVLPSLGSWLGLEQNKMMQWIVTLMIFGIVMFLISGFVHYGSVVRHSPVAKFMRWVFFYILGGAMVVMLILLAIDKRVPSKLW